MGYKNEKINSFAFVGCLGVFILKSDGRRLPYNRPTIQNDGRKLQYNRPLDVVCPIVMLNKIFIL